MNNSNPCTDDLIWMVLKINSHWVPLAASAKIQGWASWCSREGFLGNTRETDLQMRMCLLAHASTISNG